MSRWLRGTGRAYALVTAWMVSVAAGAAAQEDPRIAALNRTIAESSRLAAASKEEVYRQIDEFDKAMAALDEIQSKGKGTPPIPRIYAGGPVPEPHKTRDVVPAYPPIAISARVQGIVVLELTISPTGKVTSARVVRSIPLLDKAAIDAALQWEFAPSTLNGKPTAVRDTVAVTFTLT